MILDFLLERFTKENYPVVNSNRCISNELSNKDDCNKCEVACPSNAINRKKGKINIKKDSCSMCGICKSVCPTRAINMNGFGEENVLRTIKDRENIIFSCSKISESRNLKFNCLNGIHVEFLISLFIEYREKVFHFNVTKCDNCEICDDEKLLLSTINKASNFLKPLGIEPKYEIARTHSDIKDLSNCETFSRRDLLTLLGKESKNLATGTMEVLARDDEKFLSVRDFFNNTLHKNLDILNDTNLNSSAFIASWEVRNSCNGCEKCKSVCPNDAWKIGSSEGKLNFYHNSGKCFKCGRCVGLCPQKAIQEGDLRIKEMKSYVLKNSLELTTCTSCQKDFVSAHGEMECSLCKDRKILRSRIASIEG